MISGLLPKIGIGVLGLGTSGVVGYGVYELTRTKSIGEILSRSYKVLKTEGDSDKQDWTELIKKYKSANDSVEPKKISGLPETGSTVEEEKLKTKCAELLKKTYTKEDDRSYMDAKNWCTNSLILKKQ